MPFILGVLISNWTVGHSGFRDARKHLWRSSGVYSFGPDPRYLRGSHFRVVVRTIESIKAIGRVQLLTSLLSELCLLKEVPVAHEWKATMGNILEVEQVNAVEAVESTELQRAALGLS